MYGRFVITLAGWVICASWCRADDSATLFTDPVVQIKAIDGDPSRKVLVFDTRADRGAKLSPGGHVLDVCYYRFTATNNGAFVSQSYVNCDVDRKLPFDAQAGHVYRLKLALLPGDWKAWVEDVTADEAALLAEAPAPKAKGGGKSVVLLRVVPGDIGVATATGRIDHIWFVPGMWGIFPMKGDPADGFLSRKVSAGTTLGITDLNTPKSGLISSKTEFICGDTRVPVLDNVPGGGAFYVGELHFTSTPTGPRVDVTHDGLEAARDFLRKTEPALADRLQHATLKWKRLPEFCAVDPHQVLRIDPGQTATSAN